jgi:methionine-rich copper-binding protein CopC
MRTHIFVASVLIALIANGGAHAHAMLASATPSVGGSVGAAPRQVTLSFTQGLEPSFSSVQVTDSKGARVDLGKPQISGSTMSVGLKSLGPGTYRVNWHVLSVDTHKTQGSFSFHVGGQ